MYVHLQVLTVEIPKTGRQSSPGRAICTRYVDASGLPGGNLAEASICIQILEDEHRALWFGHQEFLVRGAIGSKRDQLTCIAIERQQVL